MRDHSCFVSSFLTSLPIAFFAMMAGLSPAPRAFAEEITVCQGGCDFSSVNAAIAAADPGDVIAISAGRHFEGSVIDTQGKPITLRGVADIDGDGVPETILDGGDVHRVLICQNDESVETRFQSLVIEHGRTTSQSGGGGMYNDGCSPTFSDCFFRDNQATGGGGGMINAFDGNPVLENCTFIGNAAPLGGGMCNDQGSPVLTGCLFTNNTASRDGGAMFNLDSHVTMTGCTITLNDAGDSGGGAFDRRGSSELTDCRITDNSAGDFGGGLYNDATERSMNDSFVCGNTSGGISSDENQIEGDPLTSSSSNNFIRGDCDHCDDASQAPETNPGLNPDGTMTYWCGNNMQWDIQEAIDDARPGDTIVVRGGDYVDSLTVDKPDLTIRPFVCQNGEWEVVNFWNPTQGPAAQNGWAMLVGSNTENTTIGRPHRFRQLPTGFVAETLVVPGEYSNPAGAGIPVDSIVGTCFTFWSRSVDNTGVMSVGGRLTVADCVFTSFNGFGGAVILTGEDNDTSFIDCTFENLFANGSTLRTDVEGLDLANHCISIHADDVGTMEYTFSNCVIRENRGETIIHQGGGGGSWADCVIEDNSAETNYGGVVTLHGCNPRFDSTAFLNNSSGYGTVFMNGVGVSSLDGVRFSNCVFDGNATIDGQWGGVIYAEDDKSETGTAPKVMFTSCRVDGNNANIDLDPDDFVTPWFPAYRQGGSNEEALDASDGGTCHPSADLNGDGIVNGADMGIMFGAWGTEGTL
jgi:hypothetical protein